MYTFVRKFLFLFDPEKVHHFTLNALRWFLKIPGMNSLIKKQYCLSDPSLSRVLWNISFPNPVGLAAGFDKNGEYIHELSAFGFGFIEIGTVTPKPQKGNPKPRLFRLTENEALINRMGFNNEGMSEISQNCRKRPRNKVIIGGNIGKNKDTANDNAWLDYVKSWESLYPYVDYFVVNVSSPNTPNLRELQEKEPLKKILMAVKDKAVKENKNKPILLKISPDLNHSAMDDIIEIILELKLDGIVATNTTLNRDLIPASIPFRNETGGLSGSPLKDASTEMIRYINQKCEGKFPIIGVGGINSPDDALEKLKAGASLVQIYTGFIYQGPSLIKKINQAILKN